MKTMKILLPVAALFISALAFGQKDQGKYRENRNYQNGPARSNEARVQGSVQANAHANENAQRNANENSVLNGTGTVKTKYKARTQRPDAIKRKYSRKKA